MMNCQHLKPNVFPPVGPVPSRGSPLIPFLPFPLSRSPHLSQIKLNQTKLTQKIILSGKQVRKFAPRPSPSPKPIRLCVGPLWQLNYGPMTQCDQSNPVPESELLSGRRLPELLAPAGDWDCVRAAAENGADAIYFGLEKFNGRIRAHN